MSSFRILVLGSALVLIFGAAFFGRAAIIGFFSNLRLAFTSSADPNFSYKNFRALETENAGLRSQIATLEGRQSATGTPAWGGGRYRFFPAQVYSNYPWNDYAALVIAAGSRDGLKPGMPVVAAGGVLIGEVKTVSGDQSEVETVFDPAWKSAVVLGTGRVKALLTGGSTPGLDLVPKNAGVRMGDDIVNVAPDLPMDLPIGQVTHISETPAGLWVQAQASLPWDPGSLNEVYVITNFP